MTDRVIAFTVSLERPIREDDAEPIIEAIRQLRGVMAVEPIVATPEFHVAKRQAQQELREAIWKVIDE